MEKLSKMNRAAQNISFSPYNNNVEEDDKIMFCQYCGCALTGKPYCEQCGAPYNQNICLLEKNESQSWNGPCMATECVVLVAGEATLDNTPTGNVTFIFDDNDGSILTIPVGKDIVVPSGADRRGTAIYDYITT